MKILFHKSCDIHAINIYSYDLIRISYNIINTCGTVSRPVISPTNTSTSQAYSNVSLSKGRSRPENIACPLTYYKKYIN